MIAGRFDQKSGPRAESRAGFKSPVAQDSGLERYLSSQKLRAWHGSESPADPSRTWPTRETACDRMHTSAGQTFRQQKRSSVGEDSTYSPDSRPARLPLVALFLLFCVLRFDLPDLHPVVLDGCMQGVCTEV